MKVDLAWESWIAKVLIILIKFETFQRVFMHRFCTYLIGSILPLISISLSAQNLGAERLLPHSIYKYGAFERADTTKRSIYLSFTGGDYNEGGKQILKTLKEKKILAQFFFTGDFYRAKDNHRLIKKLIKQGHYLGPHSDKHLLYASWENRDSLLISKEVFRQDLLDNYKVMADFGIEKQKTPWFMPPYEWYNQQISIWTRELGCRLVNFSPGTRSNADYTTPNMGEKYISSDFIYENIITYERVSAHGLNGFILLIHIGTHPDRTDKFYHKLPQLIDYLRNKGYSFTLLPEISP